MTHLALDILENGGCIKLLIQKARKNGVLNYEEFLECIRSYSVTDSDQIDDLVELIDDMGIVVMSKPTSN